MAFNYGNKNQKRQKNEENLNQKKMIYKSYLRENKRKKKRGNGWGERTGAKAVTVKETRRGGSNPRLVSEFGRDK